MKEQDLIKVGHTKKTYGTGGALRLSVKDSLVEDILELEVAFLKIAGKLVPHFIEYFEYTNHLLVKFEDIDSPEAAKNLTSKEFFVRRDAITIENKPVEETAFAAYVGFDLIDQKIGNLGPISEVIEMPQQWMAVIEFREKEVLIPLHQDLIITIRPEQRQIEMELPDGLLAIND